MPSYSAFLSRYIRYFFTAAITALVTSSCASTHRQKVLPTYESTTGLQFPESLVDLACLANTFPSKFRRQSEEIGTCVTRVTSNYTEIKQIDGLLYDQTDQSFISNTYPSLGIKGFHLKVFERKELDENNNRYVFVVVRHQEHESMLTDEMNEMMSLFGAAATVDRQQGNKETFGASAVSSMLRFVRRQFGLDYLPQAINIFNKIQRHYNDKENTKYIFSGFSSGGLYAIILALYFRWPAITFSATGVEDIVNIFYSDLFAEKNKQSDIPPIFNFAHALDHIPQLDCQLGTLCLFESNDLSEEQQQQLTEKEMESLHLSTIFGETDPEIIQWLQQSEQWTCTTADDYNLKYGSCQRERLRWKDRMKAKQDL